MSRLSFGIASPLPSFNVLESARGRVLSQGLRRQNGYNLMKRAAQRSVELTILAALRERRDLPLPMAGPLTLSCWWGPSKTDPDNQAAGKKIILDALVNAGVLANDRRWRRDGDGTIARLVDEFSDDSTAGFAVVVQLRPWEP
jgi:hypothetical protein